MPAGTVLSLTGASCSLVQPLFVGELFEELPSARSFGDIRYLFLFIILFIALEFLGTFMGEFVVSIGREMALKRMRDRIFSSM